MDIILVLIFTPSGEYGFLNHVRRLHSPFFTDACKENALGYYSSVGKGVMLFPSQDCPSRHVWSEGVFWEVITVSDQVAEQGHGLFAGKHQLTLLTFVGANSEGEIRASQLG